jgi:hypothetical protein
MLAIASFVFIMAALAAWFVVPSSISTVNEWLQLGTRAVLVVFAGAIAWRIIAFIRSLNRRLDEMRASRVEDKEAEMRELAAIAATMAVASGAFPLKRRQIVDSEIAAMLRIAREIETQNKRIVSSLSGIPNVTERSLETACDIYNLFVQSGYKLSTPRKTDDVAIGHISRKVVESVQSGRSAIGPSNQLHAIFQRSKIVEIIGLEPGENESDPEQIAKIGRLILWLRSIEVGLVESQ